MEYGYIDIDTESDTQPLCEGPHDDDLSRVWYSPSYGTPKECLVLPPAPVCEQAGWTRVNHLGNSRDGVPLNFTWTIPYFPSNTSKLAVVRIRLVGMMSLCVVCRDANNIGELTVCCSYPQRLSLN